MNQKNVEVTIMNRYVFVSASARQQGRGGAVRRHRVARLVLAGSVALGLIVIGVQPAAAAITWYVNGATGNDSNACMSAAMACKTIQGAVNKASFGDTIMVAAWTYLESVNVDKGLLIAG